MKKIKSKKVKSIHFVGIKGVGVAPLAIIAKEAGFSVSGSDIKEDFITSAPLSRSGIVPFIGFSKDNVKNIDLVITTSAHGGVKNIEVIEAKKKGIPVWTQGQAVGEFMKGEIFEKNFFGISVAGSHGKTTTTAMLVTILKYNNYDPSFLVGTGDVPCLGDPGYLGGGKYFIAEADEYATEPKFDKQPKFLWQHPNLSIFTNIEFDHPDIYKSIDEIRESFLSFANQLPESGILVACADDNQIKKLIKNYRGRVITFGFSPTNNFVIDRVTVSGKKTFFWTSVNGSSLGEFSLGVLGEFNVLNGLGAIVAALEIGLPIHKIKDALLRFTGTKRRFEYIGKLKTGGKLYDDYAHHPTEIRETLKAFRQNFSKSKIVCVFQPHTYSRTKALFNEFIYSFNDSDTLILTNIYPSLREEPDPNVSSELLANKISIFHKDVVFLPKLSDVVEYVNQKGYGENTIVITMGAGDIYKIASSLLGTSV